MKYFNSHAPIQQDNRAKERITNICVEGCLKLAETLKQWYANSDAVVISRFSFKEC